MTLTRHRFNRTGISKRSARAIAHHFMTLYDLKAEDAEKAACDLFDMTMGIIQEYRNKERRP
ncbi:hypothetical protein AML29_26195 [Escherichia coli]|nr:hypothetical protein AML29_26195 [Escherichia coli]KYT88208.1 hypothetical protein AML60_25850 [Escherichia coli]